MSVNYLDLEADLRDRRDGVSAPPPSLGHAGAVVYLSGWAVAFLLGMVTGWMALVSTLLLMLSR